jgi:hypothetical protein
MGLDRLLRWLTICPSCGAIVRLVDRADGTKGIEGARQVMPDEMLRDFERQPLLMCLQCGSGIDAEGRGVSRRHRPGLL